MIKRIYPIIILFFVCTSCTVAGSLKRKKHNATIAYVAKTKHTEAEQKKESPKATVKTVVKDTLTSFLTEGIIVNNEVMMNLNMQDVVVVARSRTIPERNGYVEIGFEITLPKELQGNYRNIAVTPVIHNRDKKESLQEVTIKGSIFEKVQNRDYWQYTQYLNVHKPKDSISKKKAFDHFIKFPISQHARLDSIIKGKETISYLYTQRVPTAQSDRSLTVTLEGSVTGVDGSRYKFQTKDTLRYNISSMITFIDTTSKFLTHIVERQLTVVNRSLLCFNLSDDKIIDTLGHNASQLQKITKLMEHIISQDEFLIDSISLTAAASPEGNAIKNRQLSQKRAIALKAYLNNRFFGIEELIHIRCIGEDWKSLTLMISQNTKLQNREEILKICHSNMDIDQKEMKLKREFPCQYEQIKTEIYPLLRAVNFEYNLRRKGMIKDTLHTSIPDTTYTKGVQLLKNRSYSQALYYLNTYEDRNTAITLLSLNQNERALQILAKLPKEAITEYLSAIACARLNRKEQGIIHLENACLLDEKMRFRSKLDPEISTLQ